MANERPGVLGQARAGTGVEIDQGLRAYMLKIYNYMGLALGVTGAVAFAVASSQAMMQAIHGTALAWAWPV